MENRKNQILWILAIVFMALGAGMYFLGGQERYREIRISSNPWVGFTPFIYAQEKGWLEKSPFRFSWVVDLSENARLYERGFTQGFTATQYEMLHFKDYSHIKPIFLIDRSAGADAILANRPLSELKKTKETIPVYLELGSLNEDFFKAFVKENKLEQLKCKLVDTSQKEIAGLMAQGSPMMVITYAPYSSELQRKGFLTVGSTLELQSFFVIDALFMDERAVSATAEEFQQLKKIFDRAQGQLKINPREYYDVIKGYLEGQSFEEFMATTTQIEWLNRGDTTRYQQQLNIHNIKTDRLLP